MNLLDRALHHLTEVAKIPSFSSYEERLHPYVERIFNDISEAKPIGVPGNSLVYQVKGNENRTIALTAHLDKINHYGRDFPDQLPVYQSSNYVEGAMDNSLGVGVLLTFAELSKHTELPNLLFFFSEMEEKKGLKEHPELLKNNGKGYESGMGARNIANRCLEIELIPDVIITVDTTPLFEGEPGVALYSRHWELNDLEAGDVLIQQTKKVEREFKSIDSDIKIDNNTNDYLHYGQVFNQTWEHVVPSVALEPAIYPYHQKGESVFLSDIKRVLEVLKAYLKGNIS